MRFRKKSQTEHSKDGNPSVQFLDDELHDTELGGINQKYDIERENGRLT